jgi:exodeoxyribonuclease VII large subunit
MRQRLERESAEVHALQERAHRRGAGLVEAALADVRHLRARIVALSPQATLQRGYAVVQRPDGGIVRRPQDVTAGDRLSVRVAAGRFPVRAEPVPDA